MTSLLTSAKILLRVRWGIALISTLCLAGALVYWWSVKAPTQEIATPLERWIPVSPQRLEKQLGLTGRIRPVHEETLSSPFEGEVKALYVTEGQRVEKGQKLITLDNGLVEIQLRQTQTELLKAQKEADNYHNWHRSPDVARARRGVQSAQFTLTNSKKNLRDTRLLFERGIVARMEVEALEQLVAAQQQALDSALDDLYAVEAQGGSNYLKIAEMALANARTRYDILLAQSKKQTLYAPFSGVVARPQSSDVGRTAALHVGTPVSQGTELLTVVGLDTLQVVSRVEEIDLHQLREGMPVRITGDGFSSKTLSGRVKAIGMQDNASDSQGAYYDVIVSIDSPVADLQPDIRLGMSARLDVITYRNDRATTVPVASLQTDDKTGERFVVYRQSPAAPHQKITVSIEETVVQGAVVKGISAGEVRIAQ